MKASRTLIKESRLSRNVCKAISAALRYTPRIASGRQRPLPDVRRGRPTFYASRAHTVDQVLREAERNPFRDVKRLALRVTITRQ
jgi:hypothetical protein